MSIVLEVFLFIRVRFICVSNYLVYFFIRADHDDQEVIVFNRCMLPAYYGLLRLCCQQSRTFTRQLANHQNIQWAFKNITPYTTQYNAVSISSFIKLFLFQPTTMCILSLLLSLWKLCLWVLMIMIDHCCLFLSHINY